MIQQAIMLHGVKNMKKTILLHGRAVEYELQRKKVKNINIRVKRNLTVTVSASPRVSSTTIEEILREKADFILSALEKYEKQLSSSPKCSTELNDGDIIPLFGYSVPLSLRQGNKSSVEMTDGRLILTVKDTNDLALKKKTLQKYLDELCRDMIERLCQKVHPSFTKYVPQMPEIKFRHMKSRWGSCSSTKKLLTFNYALVHAPVDCIEYVVYHEFTHFIHQNHSKSYYAELSRFVPDYKDKRKRLAKVNINL